MDRQQVETLFRQHYRRMYTIAFGLLYDEQESKDVVSDVFASLLESNIKLLPETTEGYLFRAVRNRCLKHLRGKSNRERIERLYVSSLSDNDNTDEERLQQLLAFATHNLTEQDLKLFTMRFIDGKDYKVICDTTGLSRITVWKHLTQVMKKLKGLNLK